MLVVFTKLTYVNAQINPCVPINGTLANNVYPDQTPQNSASDQGLHCLLTEIPIQNKVHVKLQEFLFEVK